MTPDEAGRWRFCPACGRPLMLPYFVSEDQNSDDFDYTAPRCSCCERPWVACPCTPADEGECQSVLPESNEGEK